MKTDKNFLDNLKDNICAWGATSKLIIDHDQSEVITNAQNIFPALFIDDWKIKPYY